MTTVFVTHPADKLDLYFGPRAERTLRGFADVRLNPESRDLDTAELVAAARDCDALIAYRQTPGTAELFQRLPRLAVFLRCAIDIRTVDVAAASAAGVLVTQASAGFHAAVAEWVVAAMIDLGRGITRYASAYQRGEVPASTMGVELRGATIGVVGYGGIGRTLAALALAFGMRVIVSDPKVVEPQPGIEVRPLPELLAASDFVVCLAVLTPQTTNLIDDSAFAAMKRGAYFVNASRGELVDEAALRSALDRGHLAGCAIDVGRAPDQMPSLELARHPRVIATPHMAGLTRPATEHQAMETVAQLRALIEGRIPTGAVNAAHATRWQSWPQH